MHTYPLSQRNYVSKSVIWNLECPIREIILYMMIDFVYFPKSPFHIIEPNYLLLETVYRVPVQKAIFWLL